MATFCLCMCHINAFAAAKKEYKIEDDGFEWYLITENGKQGAQDKNGNVLIPVEYKKVFYFTLFEGHFEVISLNDHMGIYTMKGRCLIPVSRQYTNITDYGTEYNDVKYFCCFKKDNDRQYLYALCNYKGEEVWKPKKKYALVHLEGNYYNHRLPFYVTDFETGKKGIIDKDENVIIPIIYESSIILLEKNKEYVFSTEVNDEFVTIGKLNDISPCENIFPKRSFNALPVITDTHSTTTNIQSQKVTLNTMIGKHYIIEALVIGDYSLPLEGDLGIAKSGLIIALGDGKGIAEEFHVYFIEKMVNDFKWNISSERGKGFIEILDQNTQRILIRVQEGDINNIFVLKNKPYDKPTLKE